MDLRKEGVGGGGGGGGGGGEKKNITSHYPLNMIDFGEKPSRVSKKKKKKNLFFSKINHIKWVIACDIFFTPPPPKKRKKNLFFAKINHI